MEKKFIFILTMILFLCGGGLALADSLPSLPAAYYGSVMYSDQTPVATGTVEVLAGGQVCGQIPIYNGKYGESEKLTVADNGNMAGQQLEFRVKLSGGSEVMANETATWSSGSVEELNLSLSVAAPVSESGSTGGTTTTTTGTTQGSGTSTSTGSSSSSSSTTGSTSSTTSQSSSSSSTSSTANTNSAGGTSSSTAAASSKDNTANTNSEASEMSSSSITGNVAAFKDLATAHWAYEDIRFMVGRNIIKGTSANSIDPEGIVSRAQFTAILVRTLGISPVNEKLPFTDVKAGSWYCNEVAAAYKSGLVQGTGITSFSPDASISREQMAVLLVRALVKHNKQAVLSQEEANQILTSWQDKGLVHSWAAQELATAIKLGLVKGQTASRLAPQNTATRAEAAAMVHRFIDFAKL